MKDLIEIRWHGRGGQGAKTAALLLAEAAVEEGKYGQGFPDYGPERMGAPIRSFNRISGKPIYLHCHVSEPDMVVVLDDSLLDTVDVTDGLDEDGVLLVNSTKSPSEIREKTKLKGGKLYTIDATGISMDELGRPIPNTPMIGALLKATDLLDIELLLSGVRHKFSGKFSDKIVQGNIRAIKRAYEEVKED